MHMDPIMPLLVASAALVLLVGAVAKRLRLPHVVGYIGVGALLGSSGLHLFTDVVAIERIGAFGVILLLFFAGLEVDLPKLVIGWRVSVLGTTVQILASVGIVALVGIPLGWPTARVFLYGFAISLSSTALVLSMLRQWKEMDSGSGIDAIGILLVQDVAVIGMLIVLGTFSGERMETGDLMLQALGGVAAIALVVVLSRGVRIRLPFADLMREDHELQVFAAFGLCFGLAWITALLGLSGALGAFLAGLLMAATRETDWVHRSLEPFRVLLVAVFFVSIGMLLEFDVLADNVVVVLGLIGLAFVTNTAINAAILRVLGRSWRNGLYIGALLSQVGEFSFVLAAVGRAAGIITPTTHQIVIGVIAGSLLLGPAWIAIWRPFGKPDPDSGDGRMQVAVADDPTR